MSGSLKLYSVAARSPNRLRGKWHLLLYATTGTTICGQRVRGWDTARRDVLDPRAICANCLRDTP